MIRAAFLSVPLLATLAVGCPSVGGGVAGAGGVAAATRAERAPPELRLKGIEPFAAAYDTQTPVDLDEIQGALLVQLRDAATRVQQRPPETDREVIRATFEICRGLPAEGPPPAALVDFGLRSHGVIDPPPHLVVADLPPTGSVKLSSELRDRLARVLRRRYYRRVGLAVCRPLLTPRRRRVVVALFEGRLRIASLPRRLAKGMVFEVRARVLSAHRDPQLVIADPLGKVTMQRMRSSGIDRVAKLRCDRAGLYQVEVTGVGQHGSEVLANFPVYCGVPPPSSTRVFAHRPVLRDAAQVEGELVRLTNALRRNAGLPTLADHRALRAVARAHSRDMQAADFVGHISKSTGGPADRVRRARIPFLIVRENVARAYSASEALHQLAQSPAHLSNLLNTDTTHLGIGVVIDRSQSLPVLLITQNFISLGRTFNPKTAYRDAKALIDAKRRAAGVSAVSHSPILSRLAQAYLADFFAKGAKHADRKLNAALNKLGASFSRLGGLLLKVSVLDGIAQAKEIVAVDIAAVGLGIRRESSGRIVVFVLLGKTR
ncbi:MAG: hypothetical protein CSA65_06745 [Proteobacteria bacterium]|nr:MAG: hypothetical protein CSB49_00275 [Pseudomonadota bacterium]PIE17979.1 MAG: hypothetical protein CSA65_06745 [Pseudomonadota bacterium]